VSITSGMENMPLSDSKSNQDSKHVSFQLIQKTALAALSYTPGHRFVPDEVIGSFNSPNPSSCTVTLELPHPLTEMSARNNPRSKGWPAHNNDNLAAICEPIVSKMWEP
jgi:hypothetical protein